MSRNVTKIIVATSKDKSDDKLVSYLKKINVSYFRGCLNNVAKRFLHVALLNNEKNFIRISGDSPFIDPKIIDKASLIFSKNKNYDIITNIFPKSFPKGQSVEIISTKILKKNLMNMSTFDKEHVTNFFYKNSKKFLIKNFINKNKNFNFNTAVDYKKDLKIILDNLNKKT